MLLKRRTALSRCLSCCNRSQLVRTACETRWLRLQMRLHSLLPCPRASPRADRTASSIRSGEHLTPSLLMLDPCVAHVPAQQSRSTGSRREVLTYACSYSVG